MISNRRQYHLYHEGLSVLFHRFLGILIYWLAFNQPLDWKRFIFRKWSYEIQLSYILMSSFQLCLSVLPINIVNNISSIFWIFKSQAWHSSIRSLWFFFFNIYHSAISVLFLCSCHHFRDLETTTICIKKDIR